MHGTVQAVPGFGQKDPSPEKNQGQKRTINFFNINFLPPTQNLGGRFGYFLFLLLGEGEGGSPRCQRRGGGSVLIENPRRRGGLQDWEGPAGCLRRIGEFFWGGGGGPNIFFWGRNVHPETLHFGPPKKGLCASYPGKERKKSDPHKLFRG